MHKGLDIASAYGTPIMARADGVASFIGPLRDFGDVVFINHGHGFATFYAHTSTIRVKEGQPVKRGQIIACIKTSGRTTGPHLHYEVQVNGAAVNPLKYIVDPTAVKFANQSEADGQS
jgi:murein DD-endopeptidase MepM/ murein hydrolase activator NlpD